MARKHDKLRNQLETKKDELLARIERVTANVRRGYEADSEERAKQMEDHEVVDALGNAHIAYEDRTNDNAKYAIVAAPE